MATVFAAFYFLPLSAPRFDGAVHEALISAFAVVAIGGLLVPTLLTMVYMPILYSLFEDARLALQKRFGHQASAVRAVAAPLA